MNINSSTKVFFPFAEPLDLGYFKRAAEPYRTMMKSGYTGQVSRLDRQVNRIGQGLNPKVPTHIVSRKMGTRADGLNQIEVSKEGVTLFPTGLKALACLTGKRAFGTDIRALKNAAVTRCFDRALNVYEEIKFEMAIRQEELDQENSISDENSDEESEMIETESIAWGSKFVLHPPKLPEKDADTITARQRIFDIALMNRLFDKKNGKHVNLSDNKSVKKLIKSLVQRNGQTSKIKAEFFRELDRRHLSRGHKDFINGYSVANAKAAFNEVSKGMNGGVAAAAAGRNQQNFSSQGFVGRYQYFNQASSTVYQSLSPQRYGANFIEKAEKGGASSIAYDVYANDKNAKIGVMIAANSGLPGGALGNRLKSSHIPRDFEQKLQHYLNVNTQEESVLAAAILSGISSQNSPIDKENYLKSVLSQLEGSWGMSQPVHYSRDTHTIQGIDFTKSTNSKDYANVHVITGNLSLSPVLGRDKNKRIDETKRCPISQFVFADSVNANQRKGTPKGSMQRTLNRKAANDYEFFKSCIKEKLRASLDAMAAGGITHALVAPLSTGVYAGDHKYDIGRDFLGILDEVLEEPVGLNNIKRGRYFKEVILAGIK